MKSDNPSRTDSPQALLWRIHSRFCGDSGQAYRSSFGALSFSQLYGASGALYETLSALPDAKNRTPVLIWGHKDLRYPIAYWACLLSGRPLVPVEPETPPERTRQIAETCKATAVVVASDNVKDLDNVAAALNGTSITVLPVDIEAGSQRPLTPPTGVVPDDVAYIMFSSGTLGRPKGIQVTYANLADFITWLDILLPETNLGAVSGNIRYCFDVSLFEIWMSWTRRIPLTALDHADFAISTAYIERLASDGVALWVSTPSITRLLLKNSRFNSTSLPEIRCFLFCGEPLTKPIVEELYRRFPGCRVINTYGPTECTVAVSAIDITQVHVDAPNDLPIGYARPGVSLLTASGTPTGEILIGGACVGKGYIGLPEKQIHAFPTPATYRSGDWGRVDSDGLWYFCGRMDREVKIQGVRIDLSEVEAHIRRQPGVEDAIVDTYVLRGEPRALNAYVIGVKSSESLARLAGILGKELPPYLVPRFWYAGLQINLNNNSKLDRSSLVLASESAEFRHVHNQTSSAARG